MHHPDLHDIVASINDFFLLTDLLGQCEIKPLSMKITPESRHGLTFDPVDSYGLVIKHCLNNGYIHVCVMGLGKDDNTTTVSYFSQENSLDPVLSIDIGHEKRCSTAAIRDAIRQVIKQDREIIERNRTVAEI